MKIDTNLLDPNNTGEVLKQFAFTDWGYGTYINSNINSLFQVVDSKPILEDLLTPYNPYLPEDWLKFDYKIKYYFYQINASKKLVVIFWNDGDTTLIFNDCGRILLNTDAKKDYGWSEVKLCENT